MLSACGGSMPMMPMMPRCACRGEQQSRGRVQCRPPHLGMTLKRLLDGARRIAVYPRSPAGPSRRIAEKVERGVDALANALSARRRARACRWPGVSAPSHIRASVVALPTTSLISLQEQTLASPPSTLPIHSLAIVSRLFHAEKGIQRVQSCGPG